MPTPADFLEATKYFGIATLAMAGITLLAFVFGWGFRFRLVGITSFMGVLTGGMLGLSFEPFTRTVVPGSVPYSTVYDSGATQIVIKVSDDITPSELEATLQQAASNLLKPSRLGGMRGETPTIRARTIVHEPEGISKLVYLGQVQPSSKANSDQPLSIEISEKAFTELPQS
ncbi:Ycf51 family protein [Oscillatoria sp. CS-180]|uniref:Ycf51 family protein n=1 Tax=Oscillatoria sp. CS-180 TaxID=3021720 RepID=UPI00232C8044|nr:Ycf51 family protein [Oscillatoria sp. CS-180]MDB9527363.1 Ycf51 family protein [Oscillatoria sp. CS-180]